MAVRHQSLGEFLQLRGLTMASFSGLFVEDALWVARLDNDTLAHSSDDLRSRLTPIQRDLIAALRRGGAVAETDAPGTDSPQDKSLPGYPDTSDKGDVFEIDPKTGKPRKKPRKAEEQGDETASSDDDQIPQPVPQSPPDKSIPSGTAWPMIPAATKIFALMIVNAVRARRGLPALSRLVQDEVPATVDELPSAVEGRARAVVNCGRRARGMKPVSARDWVSISELRGG